MRSTNFHLYGLSQAGVKSAVSPIFNFLPELPVILSPMAGYSDSPYRLICRRLGSAMSITEFVSTDPLMAGSVKSIKLFRYEEAERPVIFQVFGNKPDTILEACKKILPLGPDGIDLNMGCSVKKVAHKGSGVGLMRDPDKVRNIVSRMVKELQVPVSVKIRMGWNHSLLNYLEIGRIAEGEGAWGITLHGRTKEMAYKGEADWQAIANLKQHLTIPVFGNGDVGSIAEARLRMKQSGVDGVFIGRSAIGNPWVFQESGRPQSFAGRLPVILEHLEAMHRFYGERGIILFRKHLVKYLLDLDFFQQHRPHLLQIEDLHELRDCLYGFIDLAA